MAFTDSAGDNCCASTEPGKVIEVITARMNASNT
jgi:hypothetical protein